MPHRFVAMTIRRRAMMNRHSHAKSACGFCAVGGEIAVNRTSRVAGRSILTAICCDGTDRISDIGERMMDRQLTGGQKWIRASCRQMIIEATGTIIEAVNWVWM